MSERAEERLFPILHTKQKIPWRFVEPYRQQIEANHRQTLERLAERGGLAWTEIWAGINGHRPGDKAHGEDAAMACAVRAILDRAADTIAALQLEATSAKHASARTRDELTDTRKDRDRLLRDHNNLHDRYAALERERDEAVKALEDVVTEYPVSAGTTKWLPHDEQGYGSIRRAYLTLKQLRGGE